MLKQGLLKDHFATNVDHVTALVTQEALVVYDTALAINKTALIVLLKNMLTAWVHLEVAQHTTDIEASEGEDLRKFSVLELSIKEEDLAFA